MPSPKSASQGSRTSGGSRSAAQSGASSEGSSGLAEQLLNRVIRPLGLVVLTRDRIQEVLDDAAARGRVTRSDANELVTELVNRGRQQTEQLLRSMDKARRSVGAGQSFPILGYDELTAAQVQTRLDGLSPPELRRVRDYERRHANRKSVLAALDKQLTAD